MKKRKLRIPIIALLVSVLGIATLVSIAQSQNGENKTDNFDDNLNIARVFRLVNSLNKEAEKQQAEGFEKRAEMLKNYFQKKTGVSNEASLKLKELATNFQNESERLNAEIKEVRKNQQNKPNDEALAAEFTKLWESRNKLFDLSRQSLHNEVAKNDFAKILKFLREKILNKSKKIDKSKLKKDFGKPQQVSWFSNIEYSESSTFEDEINGYSMIDYDPVAGEIFAMAYTEGICEFINQDHEQDYGCRGAAVYSEIKNEVGEVLDENGNDGAGDWAEVDFYANEFGGQPLWNGQYCIYSQHGIETNNDYQWIYAESNDCVEVEIPEETPEISSVEFEEIDSTLDTNPGNGNPNTNIGLRIFPDKENPTDTTNRATVTIKATVSPAVEDVEIHFKTFDLDDPSSNSAPVDSNGSLGSDNRGVVNSKKEGELTGGSNAASAMTDSNGVATVVLTVTKQPGDNFAVVASKDSSYVNNIAVDGVTLKNGSQTISTSGATSTSNPAIRTEMLTVWRKLHIEVDSMGIVADNKEEGQITSTITIGAGTLATPTKTTLPVDITLEENRFESGRILIGSTGQSFRVIESTPTENANTVNSVTVLNTSSAFTVNSGDSFTLYDDDDFNDNDGTTLDGDNGEDIAEPDMNLLSNGSDNVTNNILAAAYIQTVIETAADVNDNSVFELNTAGDDATDLRPLFDDYDLTNGTSIDRRGTDNDFWTVFILGSYQHILEEDKDPHTEAIVFGIVDAITGFTDDLEGSGALIFMEVHRTREIPGYSSNPANVTSLANTVAHEVGHLFSAEHGEGEIMGNTSGTPISSRFSDITLNKIRGLPHP